LAKDCPKHVELILEINKLLLLHLVGLSVLLCLIRFIFYFENDQQKLN